MNGTTNHHSWKTATERALKSRNNLGFITGDCSRPKEDENKAIKWDRANVVVVSWLLASMFENIYATCVTAKTASELWNELEQTFEKIDGSIILMIFKRLINTLRGVIVCQITSIDLMVYGKILIH